jgi:hypothetical protein
MNNHTQKSKEALKRKQEKQDEKVKNSMQSKPEINKTSHKLGRRDEKIFERAEKELTAMNKRIEEKRRKLLEEKESKLMKELTFKPKLSTRGGAKRNIEDFFEYNLEWKRRSDKRVEMKRVEKEEQETAELKFAPEIDANSLSLVEQMGISKPIEIRLLERHQLKEKKLTEMRKEQLYPFKPTLQSKNSIRQPKKSPDVFNRLFSLSIDSNRPDKSPKFGDPRKSKSFAFSTAPRRRDAANSIVPEAPEGFAGSSDAWRFHTVHEVHTGHLAEAQDFDASWPFSQELLYG